MGVSENAWPLSKHGAVDLLTTWSRDTTSSVIIVPRIPLPQWQSRVIHISKLNSHVWKRVRFATSVYSDDQDSVTSATSYSSYDNSSDSYRPSCSNSPEIAKHKFEGPLAWWSGYTPLDSWIPPMPSQIPRFKGLIGVEPYIRFKQYKLADEVRLSQEWTNDPIANRDIRYDMCFLGEFDEVTSMLAGLSHPVTSWIYSNMILEDIHVLDMLHGPAVTRTAGPRSQGLTNLDQSPLGYIQENGGSMDRSMCDDERPDKYKFGCRIYRSGLVLSRASRSVRLRMGGSHGRRNVGSEGLPRDFGREDDSKKDGPATGLPMGEEEDAYDCGWEDAMEIQPAASSMTLGDEEDPYDCGWGDQQNDTAAPISSAATEDLYDCGWEDEEDANRVSEVANLEDPYDCGWGNDDTDNLDVVSRNDPSSKQLGRRMDSPTPIKHKRYQPMTIEIPEVIDLTSDTGSCAASSHTASQLNTFQEAGLSMHRAIQRLNSIGTHQRNEDAQNMVTDNPSGTPNQFPAGALRANRRLIVHMEKHGTE
ncbi:hypothetical protein C8R48DRAFT_679075 [Suillus tomentosus]|nr:hypothetical protein C8R48DRAFT_679075 [Suillus tomentosus]